MANFVYRKIPTNKLYSSENSLSIPIEHQLYIGKLIEDSKSLLELTIKLLTETSNLLEKNDISFLLTLGADRIQIDPEQLKNFKNQYPEHNVDPAFINRELSSFAIENKIEYIDLLSILQEENPNMEVYYKYDGHWNAHGHDIVASAIFQKLKMIDLIRRTK